MTGSSVGRTSQLREMETGFSKQELKITNVHNCDEQKSISERIALSTLVAVRIHQQTTTSGCTRQPSTGKFIYRESITAKLTHLFLVFLYKPHPQIHGHVL